jgi:hypothetical protein
MAIISIPIEITPDGDQITHTDLYKVDFTVIDYLPPPSKPLVEINLVELFSQIADKPSDELAFRNDAEDFASASDTCSDTFNDEPSNMDGSVSDITDNAEYPNYVSDIESEDLEDGFASQSERASFHDTDDNGSNTFYENTEKEPEYEDPQIYEKEIAKHRTFPKSKTIRRTHPTNNRNRFSRRANNRIIHIPPHIIRALNL